MGFSLLHNFIQSLFANQSTEGPIRNNVDKQVGGSDQLSKDTTSTYVVNFSAMWGGGREPKIFKKTSYIVCEWPQSSKRFPLGIHKRIKT